MIYLQILMILIILVAAGWYAKLRFTPKKDEKEAWKKSALSNNKALDDAFAKKKKDDYKNLLHPKVSRYQPKLPHRIDGAGEVFKWAEIEMEGSSAPSATSMVQSSAELYEMSLLVTYNYMTQTKTGDKFVEGAGKVTRLWVRVKDGWKLAHEHISTVSKD
jgi:hypothetical protein